MGGGCAPCSPAAPRYLVMQTRCKNQLVNGCRKPVCSDLRPCSAHGLEGYRRPQAPSYFVRQAQCKIQPMKGCQKRRGLMCVLIFVNVLCANGVQRLHCKWGFSLLWNARALLSKSGCAMNSCSHICPTCDIVSFLCRKMHFLLFQKGGQRHPQSPAIL